MLWFQFLSRYCLLKTREKNEEQWTSNPKVWVEKLSKWQEISDASAHLNSILSHVTCCIEPLFGGEGRDQLDPNLVAQLHLHEPVHWLKFSYLFPISSTGLLEPISNRSPSQRTAYNEWGSCSMGTGKICLNYLNLLLFIAFYKDCTLESSTFRLICKILPLYSTNTTGGTAFKHGKSPHICSQRPSSWALQ